MLVPTICWNPEKEKCGRRRGFTPRGDGHKVGAAVSFASNQSIEIVFVLLKPKYAHNSKSNKNYLHALLCSCFS